jgi:hypothetical protein
MTMATNIASRGAVLISISLQRNKAKLPKQFAGSQSQNKWLIAPNSQSQNKWEIAPDPISEEEEYADCIFLTSKYIDQVITRRRRAAKTDKTREAVEGWLYNLVFGIVEMVWSKKGRKASPYQIFKFYIYDFECFF